MKLDAEVGHRAGEAGTQQVPIALGLDYFVQQAVGSVVDQL
jgi:hypothetical protein